MAMGKRKRHAKQASMWVATQDLPRSAAHPFYVRLNQILDQHDFDRYVEGLCERFYADEGRPGLPPGRYFRFLLIGYFEGLDAERAIAWRAAERRRLKSLLRPIDRRSSTGTETLLSLRRDHGIVVYSEHFSRPAQGATTVGYKIVNKAQLVVNRLQANNGLVFDSSLDGLVSPDYSVFELRDQVRVDLGRSIDGRRQRKYAYAQTQAEAVDLLRILGGRAAANELLTTSTPTVAAFFEDWFAANTDAWRPSTRRSYRRAIDGFLVPAFGPLRLEQLTPALVQRWLIQHKTEHGAPRRITLAHATLRSALSEAKRLQMLTINAAELVKVPQPRKRPIRPFDVNEAAAFLQVANEHRLGALFSVALACGLRLGETLGLRWSDVNLETGEIQIRQQLQRVNRKLVLQDLKTEKSRRTLELPAVCLDGLRAHRTRQLAERLKAGADWIDSGLIFTSFARRGMGRKVGAALDQRNVLRTFDLLLREAKLPHIRFHDLRHSAASLLIAEGVPLVEVCQLLGHSELRVTADLYAHLQKQTASKAARHMDRLLTPIKTG